MLSGCTWLAICMMFAETGRNCKVLAERQLAAMTMDRQPVREIGSGTLQREKSQTCQEELLIFFWQRKARRGPRRHAHLASLPGQGSGESHCFRSVQ